jgi:hydroxymethylbilane synthase
MFKIRIGTRGSQLALWQAGFVEQQLKSADPGLEIERIIVKTEGDIDQKSSLARIGGTGLFTRAIEQALLAKRVDIAVHSLKDLPSSMRPGLELGAVPERGPVEDVLVTKDGKTLENIRRGAAIATGSIRRRSQILSMRSDLEMHDLRGNIDTRLRKLNEQNLDGIIMALAAIKRLQIQDVAYWVIPAGLMTPGVGQGALGIQIRTGDDKVGKAVSALNHEPSKTAAFAERAFLRELDSGCQFPVGALATVTDSDTELTGFVGSEDGVTVIRDSLRESSGDAEGLGYRLARRFIDRGALAILDGFKK